MQRYEYKAVGAPRRAKRAKGARTSTDRFARTLTDLINAEAQDGWEYLRADTLPMDEKKGMLGAANETFQTVLIFRRTTAAGAGAAAQVTELRSFRADKSEPDMPLQLGPAERSD
ncbi:MAG: DUF4177 domain-containing protein [Pseudomonadota bacterium]